MMKQLQTSMLFAFLFLVFGTSGMTQEIAIVVPNEFENAEAPAAGGYTYVFPEGYRLQGVFASSEFESLPASHHILTGIYMRPDGPTGAVKSTSWPNFTLRLSTTNVTPTNPSTEFAANIGSDETVVYQGPITFSTSNTGPPGGPKDFDITYPFQTPFYYDPAQGNLLMDWIVEGPAGWVGDDRTPGGNMIVRYVSNSNRNASFGELSVLGSTPVFQFVFVPEPSSLLTCLLGASCVAIYRRKR